jgi:hypothetical protein
MKGTAKGCGMKYSGRLQKPIVKRRVGVFSTEEDIRAAANAEVNEMFDKLDDLFAAFTLQKDDWCGLALALAKAHVPGFKFVAPAGRKTEWSVLDKAELKLDVDTIAESTGLPITEAIKRACKMEAWSAKTKKMSLPAITKHYYTADSRFVGIVRDARAWDAHESMVRDK